MLKGKSAVISGSTSGIGLGIARAFAAQGCNVMLNGFGDAAEIERLRAGLAAEHKVAVLYSSADMAKPAEVVAMMDQAKRRFGAVDVLVNNAASSTWRRLTNSPSKSGTRSSRSTCRRHFMPSAPRFPK